MIGPDPESASQEGEPRMENDERDRRDWPEQDDGGSQPVEPDWGRSEDPALPAGEPTHTEDPTTIDEGTGRDDATAPAEIESWPSQEAATAEPDRAGEEAWPASAPEHRDEPSAEERPPQEVEAYPAAAAEVAEPPAAATTAPAHSVPDAQATTGESTQCPRCGTENRPGLSFCRNCGQRLVAAGVSSTVERPGAPEGTMACPRCGTHNRAGVGFCQNCGANLRGTSEGYVPPAVAGEREAASAEPARRGAILGPVVLLIGLIGLVTAYLLPFAYGAGSLFERALGTGGYGVAFWNGYPDVAASLADQAYFGLAAPVPLLGLLLVALAVAGFVRAAPGPMQTVGLVVALLWSIGLIVLFGVVELAGNWTGDIVGLLRDLTPAGIIFFLSGLIILIGVLTRFGRS